MRTKIITTIGPASKEKSLLRDLIEEGVRIFRLNFSHGTCKDFEKTVGKLKELEKETGYPLTILQDLSGPKIRLGDFPNQTLEVTKNDVMWLGAPEDDVPTAKPVIPFPHPERIEELDPGDRVVLSDGGIHFIVEEKPNPQNALIKSLNSGIVGSRMGVAFPGKRTRLSALTEKDKTDVREGQKLGINAIAVSYVQGPEDIVELKEVLREIGAKAPVFAKLERQSAVNELESILKVSDGIMVARGDLGLELPLPTLPPLQKKIIRACNTTAKPVIVATQMLLSMINSPMPTRAETTDVANAILDGADCVMLSEETAVGKYPLETVQYMKSIAIHAETYFSEEFDPPIQPRNQEDPAHVLAYGACQLAEKFNAEGLVAHTNTGSTALLLSACRPRQTIYALSPDMGVEYYMNFSWGVSPHHISEAMDDHLERTETFVQKSPIFTSGKKVVITAGQPKPGQEHASTNLVKIYTK